MTLRRVETSAPYFESLRSGKPNYPAGALACEGFYKMRWPDKNGPWCPVSIASVHDEDEATGELQADIEYVCMVGGQRVAIDSVWPYCGRFPIAHQAYEGMMNAVIPPATGIDHTAMELQRTAQGQNVVPHVSPSPDQSFGIDQLAGALAKAQGQVEGATKDTANPFFKSKYADLSSVWGACRQALCANDLAVTQTTEAGNGETVTVVTTLMHKSGQWIRGRLTMKPVKADPQGIGSTITYARRYALAAMVGVAPEDDDGEGASGRQTRPEKRDTSLEDRNRQANSAAPQGNGNGPNLDDPIAFAREWANGTLDMVQKCRTVAEVQKITGHPKTIEGMKKLHTEFPDIYTKLMGDIGKREMKLLEGVSG